MTFTEKILQQLPDRYRINLINSLSGFKSANLIGTASEGGDFNLALFSSVFHVGANPPLLGMLSRPDGVPRHTLENIRATGVFTINSVTSTMYRQAHMCSARLARNESEFAFSKLRPKVKPGFAAPAVAESPLNIFLQVSEIRPIVVNDTVLIIGEVCDIELPSSAVMPDGYIDHEGLDSVCLSGLDGYHTTQSITRLTYAKSDQAIRDLV